MAKKFSELRDKMSPERIKANQEKMKYLLLKKCPICRSIGNSDGGGWNALIHCSNEGCIMSGERLLYKAWQDIPRTSTMGSNCNRNRNMVDKDPKI